MKRALAIIALYLVFAPSCLAATVAEAVEAATHTTPFNRAVWFVLVEDEDGHVVYERNSQLLAIPASVRKLFAVSTIVECLGPDTRLETELWIDGADVVLRGGGDPSFGSERYGYEPQTTFDPFIRAMRDRGIRRVRDVIIDVSLFDRVTIPYQWKVGNLVSDYAAPVDALMFRENEIADAAVPSPPLWAGGEFREALRTAGITVTGKVRTNIEPRPWQERLTVIRSPFVQHLLYTVLKNSHNIYAETLYKRMTGTYDGARELERETLHDAGIADDEFSFVDGSGLAPDDLVTPAAVVKILRWMNAPERRALYWNALAQPGGEGTLRNRLLPLADVMRAKTGTVAGVNSLAGIISAGGRTRYFAIIVNHHDGSSSAVTKLIDAIAEAAASHSER